MKTRSLCSPRSGKPVANQWVITTQNGEMFKSYETMIAIRSWDGQVMLDQTGTTVQRHSSTSRFCWTCR